MPSPVGCRTVTSVYSASHGPSRRSRAFVLLDEPGAGLPEAEVPGVCRVRARNPQGLRCGRPADRPQHGARDGRLRPDPRPRSGQDARGRRAGRDPRQPGCRRRPISARARLQNDEQAPSSSSRNWMSCTAPSRPFAGSTWRSASGELVGLIGPNGAGKSTTLHAIMGVVAPAAGDVRLSGQSVRGRSPEAIARAGIALVPEGRRIFGELVGGGEPPARALCSPPVATARTRSPRRTSSSRCSPTSAAARPVRSRAASSSSLRSAVRSSLRPTCCCSTSRRSGSSPTLVDTVFAALTEIRDRGVSILLVEQRAQRTVALADRTYVLANGELRMTPDPGRRGRHREDDRRRTSHDRRRRRRADAGRRDRPRRGLRIDGGRDRTRLRRPAARQLRLRAADHGRGVHARVHVRLAGGRQHRWRASQS